MYGLLAACVRYIDLICDVPDLIAPLIFSWFSTATSWPCLFFPPGPIFFLCCWGAASNLMTLRKIRGILERINIRKWIGPHAKINVEYLTSCRPWKLWPLDANIFPNMAFLWYIMVTLYIYIYTRLESNSKSIEVGSQPFFPPGPLCFVHPLVFCPWPHAAGSMPTCRWGSRVGWKEIVKGIMPTSFCAEQACIGICQTIHGLCLFN